MHRGPEISYAGNSITIPCPVSALMTEDRNIHAMAPHDTLRIPWFIPVFQEVRTRTNKR